MPAKNIEQRLVEVLRQSAISMVNQGNLRQAISILERAIAAGARTAGLWSDLGTAYFLQGDAAKAEAALLLAAELAPGSLTVLQNLAELLLVTQRFDEAMQVFQAIFLSLRPEEQNRIRPYLNPPAESAKQPIIGEDRLKAICQSMESIPGLEMVNWTIDAADFARFTCANPWAMPPFYYEKKLEYYLSTKMLCLRGDDRYVDIASLSSPYPAFVRRTVGCEVYRQDLCYKPGLNGSEIGSDAAHMPIAKASISKMALHCSFEHFEGDSDSGFIREAARVLRPGGMVCIVPLYLREQYQEERVTTFNYGGTTQNLATGCEFRRLYDAASLAARIITPAREHFRCQVFHIVNVEEIRRSLPPNQRLYCHFVALLTRK